MPPQSQSAALHLELMPGFFFVQQMKPKDGIPASMINRLQIHDGSFISVTRTHEEVSIVGEAVGEEEAKTAEWRCIKVLGPMDFGLTGILNDLTCPLKQAGISIFAISTWNTDYVLVKKEKAEAAADVLRKDGWVFT